jgi:ankyrin repeat protein
MGAMIQTDRKLDDWLRQHEMDLILFENARKGNLYPVREMLQSGANVNYKHGKISDIALTMPSYHGNVREVLKHDNAAQNINDYLRNTPLLEASRCERVEIVRELLKHKNVDVNATDKNG